MKQKVFSLLIVCCLTGSVFAQDIKPAAKGVTYGAAVNANGAIPVDKLKAKMGDSETMEAKVSGKVVEVCAKKGCFMKLETAGGDPVMVKFKDYGFFVPANLVGRKVTIEGIAKQEVMSVEKQKHYAEDMKKPAEEIARITEPKKQVTFEAAGVVVL
ncbi:MAG TPA: DUF4920 domain-containing protein [Sphingobacteriaceae bacterium]